MSWEVTFLSVYNLNILFLFWSIGTIQIFVILQLVSKGCPIRYSDFSKILRACSLVKVNINK